MIHPKGGSVRASSTATVKASYSPVGDASDAAALADLRATRTATSEADPLTFGTGESAFDHAVARDKTIAAGSSVTWDLYTGTDLTGPADETCAFRRVRHVEVQVIDGGDSSGVRIGGASSNEWVGYFAAAGDQYDIFPGGPSWRGGSPAGKAVGSTTCNLKVENLGAVAVTVRVVVAGSVVDSGYWMGFGLWTYP